MKKMLLIDDEFLFRQSIRYQLDWEKCGFWIAGEASNGQEGLELLERLRPDLVLCDLVMPVLDGAEFVRLARRRADCPPILMLSNFDEFDKVRQAFLYGATDYLLKSSFTAGVLLDAIKRHNLWMEPDGAPGIGDFSRLVRQALDGYVLPPCDALCEHVRRELPFPVYHLLYLDASPSAASQKGDWASALDIALAGWPHLCSMESYGNAVAVLGAAAPLTGDDSHKIVATVGAALPFCRCAISSPLENLADIKRRAESLAALAGYSIYGQDRRLFLQSEFTTGGDTPVFDESGYFECLDHGRVADAKRQLLDYVRKVAAGRSMPPYEFKKFLENTMYNTISRLKAKVPRSDALSSLGLKTLKQIDRAVLLGDITGAIETAFAAVQDQLPQTDPIISRMMAYIEKNYRQPITLQSAALHLHLNYAYLSSYISSNTKLHFGEHVNTLRIAQAKKLLAQSDEPISQISESVGFVDQSYFGKVFKKLTGRTPLQYRNSARRRI